MNLIDNGDFESGVSQWSCIGTCTTSVIEDPNPRPDSTRCLLVTNRAEDWMGPSLNLLTRLQPGQRYRLTVWVRTDSGNPQLDAGAPESFQIAVTQKRWCTSTSQAGGDYLQLITAATALADWSELTTTLTGPDCPDLQESSVYIEKAPIGASFCIDDTSLVAE